MAELWSVHATEDACDLAMRAPGAGRVASDEVFVRGGIPDDLRAAILTVDPAALIRESTEAWSEVVVGGNARELLASFSPLRLPDEPGYLQGEVARVPARVFVDEASITVLVPASFEHHVRRRVGEERRR